MEFKPGKLYRCPKLYLIIYPSEETATRLGAALWATWRDANAARARADALTKIFGPQAGHQVCFSEPGEIFMLLEVKNKIYLNVLFGEKQEAGRPGPTLGWIIYERWLNIKLA